MIIKVSAGRWASQYITDTVEVNLPPDATVLDAIIQAGLPEDEVGFAVVDGNVLTKDTLLTDNMAIILHPVIIGG